MRACRFRWSVGLGLALLLTGAVRARGGEAIRELLRLVPPDSGATIAVEDLRDLASQFFGSTLGEGLRRLPAVQAWRASDKYRGLQQARRLIETTLGTDLAEIRDDLFGDAVVLALRLSADERPDQARGLLLTRVRSRALLDRAIAEVNAAQRKSGEIARVAARTWHDTPYSVREFRPGTRPAEFYTTLDDNTFAWSNSETLIQGVIDRRAATKPGLGDDPRVQEVRRRLPAHPAVSLLVEPAFLRRIVASGEGPRRPGEERFAAWLGRYLDAVEYAGAALEWHDGVILHTEETLDPTRVEPWLKRWAAVPASKSGDLRVPPSALAVASVRVDFPAVLDVVESLVPESGRTSFANLLDLLRGVLLDQDVRSAILPGLGPGVLSYIEAPSGRDAQHGPPLVLVVNLDDGVADAVANALRTFLALHALDPKHGGGRLATRTIDDVEVTTLSVAGPFAYTVSEGRLIVATTPEAVARAALAGPDRRIARLRSDHFPAASSFACADLSALYRLGTQHRDRIARSLAARHHRPEEAEARDLDQALALMNLFHAAYFISQIAPDATSIHRSLGLVTRERKNDPQMDADERR